MPTISSSSREVPLASSPCAIPCSSMGSTICAPTRFTGLSAFIAPWNTMAMSFHRYGRMVASPPDRMSRPSTLTSPETVAEGGRRPIRARIVVVLPQPDSPTRPNRSPFARSNETPWTAWSFPPSSRSNHTWRSLTSSTLLPTVLIRWFDPSLVRIRSMIRLRSWWHGSAAGPEGPLLQLPDVGQALSDGRLEQGLPLFRGGQRWPSLDARTREGRPPGHDLERAVGPVEPGVLALWVGLLVHREVHVDGVGIDGQIDRCL